MFYSDRKPMNSEEHNGSLFNQKYFEGYRRAITMDDSGRMRVEFVYEGIYYTRVIPESMQHKLLFVLIPVLSLIGIIWVMSERIPMNYSKGVLFAQVLLLFMLGLNLVCGIVRLLSSKKLTRWEYRLGVISVKEISLIGALASSSLAITALIRVFSAIDSWKLVGRGLTVYFIVSVLQLLLLKIVSAEKYHQDESRDILKGIDVTDELSPMDDPDKNIWR